MDRADESTPTGTTTTTTSPGTGDSTHTSDPTTRTSDEYDVSGTTSCTQTPAPFRTPFSARTGQSVIVSPETPSPATAAVYARRNIYQELDARAPAVALVPPLSPVRLYNSPERPGGLVRSPVLAAAATPVNGSSFQLETPEAPPAATSAAVPLPPVEVFHYYVPSVEPPQGSSPDGSCSCSSSTASSHSSGDSCSCSCSCSGSMSCSCSGSHSCHSTECSTCTTFEEEVRPVRRSKKEKNGDQEKAGGEVKPDPAIEVPSVVVTPPTVIQPPQAPAAVSTRSSTVDVGTTPRPVTPGTNRGSQTATRTVAHTASITDAPTAPAITASCAVQTAVVPPTVTTVATISDSAAVATAVRGIVREELALFRHEFLAPLPSQLRASFEFGSLHSTSGPGRSGTAAATIPSVSVSSATSIVPPRGTVSRRAVGVQVTSTQRTGFIDTAPITYEDVKASLVVSVSMSSMSAKSGSGGGSTALIEHGTQTDTEPLVEEHRIVPFEGPVDFSTLPPVAALCDRFESLLKGTRKIPKPLEPSAVNAAATPDKQPQRRPMVVDLGEVAGGPSPLPRRQMDDTVPPAELAAPSPPTVPQAAHLEDDDAVVVVDLPEDDDIHQHRPEEGPTISGTSPTLPTVVDVQGDAENLPIVHPVADQPRPTTGPVMLALTLNPGDWLTYSEEAARRGVEQEWMLEWLSRCMTAAPRQLTAQITSVAAPAAVPPAQEPPGITSEELIRLLAGPAVGPLESPDRPRPTLPVPADVSPIQSVTITATSIARDWPASAFSGLLVDDAMLKPRDLSMPISQQKVSVPAAVPRSWLDTGLVLETSVAQAQSALNRQPTSKGDEQRPSRTRDSRDDLPLYMKFARAEVAARALLESSDGATRLQRRRQRLDTMPAS